MTERELLTILSTQDASEAVKLLLAEQEGRVKLTRELRLMLSYVRMQSLSQERLIRLMSESILIAYKIENFDLFQNFNDYCEKIEFVPDMLELCRQVAKLLEDNNEQLLFKANIESEKGLTISEAIKDYVAFSNVNPLEREAIDLVSYFSKSELVRKLAAGQERILNNIFQLLDFAQSNPAFADLLPEEIDINDFPEDFDWAEFYQDLYGIDFEPGQPQEEPQEAVNVDNLSSKLAMIDQKLAELKNRK
ncbi:MAG: hypothetical protein R3B41_00550 [Candidatus Doudnabacteria bacterium]